ncbi:RibD family protein [Anthocerotibacter panamensis]|uniref:RibD family protein n=1 Tax=Anthocerotibacter panamensis TaxID=2857077 RepID=UPI001C402F93|nr:RibD family protein [Anthocerotibacter panamensis]
MRPWVSLVLATSLDGKIAARRDARPGFPSVHDQAHLEMQVSLADAMLIGAGTIRAYSTAFTVRQPELLAARAERGQKPQPTLVIASRTLDLSLDWPLFRQPLERILLTGAVSLQQQAHFAGHAQVLVAGDAKGVDFAQALTELKKRGVERLVLLGGGQIVAQCFAQGLVDEWWLTLCPVIIAGVDAPSAAEGLDLPELTRGHLVEVRRIEDELFLNYRFAPRQEPVAAPSVG